MALVNSFKRNMLMANEKKKAPVAPLDEVIGYLFANHFALPKDFAATKMINGKKLFPSIVAKLKVVRPENAKQIDAAFAGVVWGGRGKASTKDSFKKPRVLNSTPAGIVAVPVGVWFDLAKEKVGETGNRHAFKRGEFVATFEAGKIIITKKP